MATIERFNSHSLSATLGSQKAASREFIVDLPVSTVMPLISTNGIVPGVPRRGEAHPYLPGLYCQAHDVREFGDSLRSVVTAVYATSNAARFQYAEPDITGSNWVKGITFQRVTVDIPFAVKVPYTYAGAGGQQTKNGWIVKTKKVRETRLVFSARWQIVNPSLNTLDAFYQQDDKVHEINSRKYVFNVGNITPRDNTFYEVEAQWTFDGGTAAVGSFNPAEYQMPVDMGYLEGDPADGLMRLPFHHLTTVAAANPNDPGQLAVPRCTNIADYEEDLNGWQSLPSIPNL